VERILDKRREPAVTIGEEQPAPDYKRKLIEVALPLEDINREAAREKSIRHGHPSTLHLWWARRPLAAARAVLFAQLVDDPSAHPDKFPTPEAQLAERERLFVIIRALVKWENSTNEKVLAAARKEIWDSCDGNPPPILDPFAGGGSIPLEAQRLGLEAHASDLNPVAVLINKALIEIPPKWAGKPPVHPEAAQRMEWRGAEGLAEDVRCYSEWIRREAERRIGGMYPKAKLSDGTLATVIAWIWARTVTCPNPACGGTMPLVRTFWLGKKKGKERYVRVVPNGTRVQFEIAGPKGRPRDGNVGRNGAECLLCGTLVPLTYVRSEGKAARMGVRKYSVIPLG
jgi:putative DNA methylase